MAEHPWFTLKLRLPFDRWSKAVDQDELPAIRAWIAETSGIIWKTLKDSE